MEIVLNYINSVEQQDPVEIKTKDDKVFYQQKIIISGDRENCLIIINSRNPLFQIKEKKNIQKKKEKS